MFNSVYFKNDLYFHFRVPPTPARALPGGGLGARGGIPPKINWYVNFGVFNSRDFKNDLYFHFRVPPTPSRAPSGGGLGGYKWKYRDNFLNPHYWKPQNWHINWFLVVYPYGPPPKGQPPHLRDALAGVTGTLKWNRDHFWNPHYWKPQNWHHLIFSGIPLWPPPQGRPCRGCWYPKIEIEIIFEIPTIENPKIDISLDFSWYTPFGPPKPPPQGCPCGGWGYSKMKIDIIFKIFTIKTQKFT